MIERRQHLRFALEAGQTFGVAGKGVWEHLDRHLPVKARVSGPVDLAHPTFTDLGGDFIRAKESAGFKRHVQLTGTRAVSSSNQSSTNVSDGSERPSLPGPPANLSNKNRSPDGSMSYRRPGLTGFTPSW